MTYKLSSLVDWSLLNDNRLQAWNSDAQIPKVKKPPKFALKRSKLRFKAKKVNDMSEIQDIKILCKAIDTICGLQTTRAGFWFNADILILLRKKLQTLK